MSAPTNLPLAIQIGNIWRGIFNWFVLVVGKDGSGNPQPLKVETDGTVNVKNAASTAVIGHVINDAGSAIIGQVGIDQTTSGTTNRVVAGGITVLPVSTVTFSVGGAAATGDYVGTSAAPQAFANAVRVSGGTGILQSLSITDKLTTAAVAMELWLFSATFTAPTDNAAWDISDAHSLLCLGVIELPAANWYATGSNKVCTVRNIGLPIKPAATSLFYALVARGTTPAWATGDVQITAGILQD